MNSLIEEILTAPASQIVEILSGATDEDIFEAASRGAGQVADIFLRAADPKLAARLISILPPEVLRDVLRRGTAEALSHFLRSIQPSQLSRVLQSASNELVERLIDAAPTRNFRISLAKALPLDRRKQWTDRVRSMERDLEHTRVVAGDATSTLFEERKRLLGDMEEAIRAKEEVLRNFEREAQMKQAHYEHLSIDARKRLEKLQEHLAVQQSQIEERERALAMRQAEFEEVNRRQVQERIEVKVPEYVAAAVRVLDEREILYRRKAALWSLQGTTVLIVAIAAAIAISLFGSGIGDSLSTLSWQTLLFVSFKGLVVLSVLGLWAKHAFTVSNAYMHEAIKRSDRAHAINFGKLYLEIYGNSVDRKELINIFENWNIASESAFAKASPASFEPQVVEKFATALKLFEKAKQQTAS